jgi:2-dehydro-3-deoxygalactonokinase
MADRAEWIAVDWGTSNLRAWVFDSTDREIAHLTSDKGMGGLAREAFEPALLDLVRPYLAEGRATPVIACGMVGARQGWVEAVYDKVPCPPPGIDRATQAPAVDRRLAVAILPGLSQDRPADVMRGEETQIAGFLAANPGFDGTICLPGTHAKWVQISAGEIVSFRTFMTGELFAAISAHTVLRHSVGGGQDPAAFAEAVRDGMTSPEALTARLFGLRAEGLLHGLGAEAATSRLSGLLIGLELAGARGYWLGTRLALVGGGGLTRLYATALEVQGVVPEIADGDDMVLAGLKAARAGQVRMGGQA